MRVKAVLMAAIILAATLTTVQFTLTYANAREDGDSAYALNLILERSIKNIQAILKEEENNQAYEALNLRLKDASMLAERAREALDRGEYQDAVNGSMRALSILNSIAAEIRESKDERTVAASHSALRMSIMLSGVKNLTEAAAAKGYNISNLKERLEAVSKLVEEARSLSAKGDSLEAGRKVAETKSKLGHLVSDLNQAYAKEKMKLAEEYVNRTLSRIFSAEEVRSKFTEQIKELNSSKDQIKMGSLGPAIKRINEAMKRMEKSIKEDLRKIDDDLLRIRKQISDLKVKGANTERVEKLVQEASRLAEQAKAYAEKGDYIAARIKIAEVEAALQRLR